LFFSGGWDLLMLGDRDIENFTSSSMTCTVSFSEPFITFTDFSALSTISYLVCARALVLAEA
jgi:hypothetical protein